MQLVSGSPSSAEQFRHQCNSRIGPRQSPSLLFCLVNLFANGFCTLCIGFWPRYGTDSIPASNIKIDLNRLFTSTRLYTSYVQGRGSRGAVEATCPHNLETVGAPPPNFGLSMSFIFIFCLFLLVNLGPSPKNSGLKPGSF